MDCHAKIENLSEEHPRFDCHPAFSEQSLVDDDYIHLYTGLPNAKVLKSVFETMLLKLPQLRGVQTLICITDVISKKFII